VKSLHVITSTARRGAETFAVELVGEMRESGHPTTVVALTSAEDEVEHEVPTLGSSRRSPGTLYALRRLSRSYEVVVAHGSSTLEAAVVALAGTGVPFIYRTIGDPSYWVSNAATQRRVGLMLRRARRHVALWDGAARQLADTYGIPRACIDVIPNGVRGERFELADRRGREAARMQLGIGTAVKCLLYVGALSPEKHVAAAIDAAARVGGAVLLIAGDGPNRRWLQEHAAATAGSRVRFLGLVADPAALYAAADLLLLPSRSEGMPAVIIEAGLVGTPTVASAVGSVPELIDDRRTGFLVPPTDVAALVSAIEEALPVASEVGRAAASRFRASYDITDIAQAWIRTCNRALREPATGRAS
jgi:glycosyltransferase involved in cell wall biosynthesis